VIASGTLYTAGGGNSRMRATLAAFIAGSVVGVYHFGWWVTTPDIWSISLITTLQQSVFADVTSVMDFGILLGAFLAAGLAGKFKPSWRVPGRSLVAAVLGGSITGYGPRLACGCNIGAFFSGIASASLHAWLWFGAAFVGSILGTQLRPLFGLAVERSATSCSGAAPQAR
jgi:uncharacterized membrane protein YedE/YeeE